MQVKILVVRQLQCLPSDSHPGPCLCEPLFEVVGVEADVVTEAVVGYALCAGLREQPGVGDAEELACGLRVDQRREGAAGTLLRPVARVRMNTAPAVRAPRDAGACAADWWG